MLINLKYFKPLILDRKSNTIDSNFWNNLTVRLINYIIVMSCIIYLNYECNILYTKVFFHKQLVIIDKIIA